MFLRLSMCLQLVSEKFTVKKPVSTRLLSGFQCNFRRVQFIYREFLINFKGWRSKMVLLWDRHFGAFPSIHADAVPTLPATQSDGL